MVQKRPKKAQNGSKWYQNDAKVTPKRSQSDPKITLHGPKNGLKSPQNDPISSHFGPCMTAKTPYIASTKGLPIFVSPRHIGTFTAKRGVCQVSNYTANCDVGVDFFWNIGVKKSRNIPFFLVRTPLTDHFGSPFRLEKVPNLHVRGLKRLKNSQR